MTSKALGDAQHGQVDRSVTAKKNNQQSQWMRFLVRRTENRVTVPIAKSDACNLGSGPKPRGPAFSFLSRQICPLRLQTRTWHTMEKRMALVADLKSTITCAARKGSEMTKPSKICARQQHHCSTCCRMW